MTSRIFRLFVFVAVFVMCFEVQQSATADTSHLQTSFFPQSAQCSPGYPPVPGDPLAGVYDQNRLVKPKNMNSIQCISITGYFFEWHKWTDGDVHACFKPDNRKWLNSGNIGVCLVIESIPQTCTRHFFVPDAITNCADGFFRTPAHPILFVHCKVIGAYVNDSQHNNQAEIHPVWKIRVLSKHKVKLSSLIRNGDLLPYKSALNGE